MIQEDTPVNLDVVEAVLAAARRRPVPPLPDTEVSLNAFFTQTLLLSRRKMKGETRTGGFAAQVHCTRLM